MSYLYVFLGGGIGSAIRYYLSSHNSGRTYPLGTTIANIIACLMLGYLATYYAKQVEESQAKLFFAVGLCGGLSTFSTFIGELYMYHKSNSLVNGVLYLCISVFLGIAAFIIGTHLHTK